MKKSKVLVPALGILCLSTAAAVTGTVAWFTASRLESVAMKNVTLVNPESGLSAVLSDNVNCTIDNTENALSVTHGLVGDAQGYLRDASVDVANDKVYKAVLTDQGGISAYAEQPIATPDVKAYDGKKVYYATSFVMTFSALNNDPDNVNNCLFFSSKLSTASVDDATKKAYSSFRVGLKAGDEWLVWAPLYEASLSSTTNNTLSYVGGETFGEDEVELTTANSVTGSATAEAETLSDSTGAIEKATAEANVHYLGVLPADAQSGLAVTVYTWFEGTDGFCNEDNWTDLQTVTASLSFISRNVKKA